MSAQADNDECAHTLTREEETILNAQPTTEMDRAKVKWPKVKKWILRRDRTQASRKTKPRPNAKGLRELLTFEGRSLNRCEACGYESSHFLQIHHIDGNPFNNNPTNLMVLCKTCHGRRHNVEEEVMNIREEYWGTILEL